MKLLAIRVRELGCFREPVALEGLTGGLDVLAGPNEAGKSTLFRAIETLFQESYKTESQKLRDGIVPYAGGAPLIEADIEAGGEVWRLRKQFFAGRMAELRSLASGEILRNADAEERARALVGGTSGPGLLWVRQRDALDPVPPDTGGRDLLRAAIEWEVRAAAGGREAEAVRRAVKATLEDLVSLKQQRPRGTYKAAIDRVATLERKLVAAEATAQAAEDHMAALARLREEAAVLAAPATASARAEALAGLDRRIAEDDDLARDLAVVTERGDHLARQALQAADAATRLEHAIAAAQMLDHEIAGMAASQSHLADEINVLRVATEQATTAMRAAHEEEQRLATSMARARQRHQVRRVAAQLAEAETADAERARQAAVLIANPMTPEHLARIEAEARDIAILDARMLAEAPIVAVILGDRGAGKVRADGTPLSQSQVFRPAEALTLSIPGIAEIRIARGGEAGDAELTMSLRARRQALAALLAEVSVASLTEARAKATERSLAEQAWREAGARLSALAPEGLDGLRQALSEGVSSTPAEGARTGDEPAIDDLQSQYADARLAREGKTTNHAAAAARLTEATTREAVIVARLEERRAALAKLEDELPPLDQRASLRESAFTDKRDAALRANTAADEMARQARRRLPAEERQRLLVQRAEVTGERDRTERRLREIEREGARLDGLIESDAEASTGSEAARLSEEMHEARRALAEIETEVAGLALLERTFEAVASEGIAGYLEPILERLRPDLGALLAAEGAVLGGDLGFAGLIRQGRTEPGERLSTGTREQIAVLVRLAFASILARSGQPVPVILDDALVYADDDRLLTMLQLLRHAARAHQVILLTCRTRVMAEAGFSPLHLRPWSP